MTLTSKDKVIWEATQLEKLILGWSQAITHVNDRVGKSVGANGRIEDADARWEADLVPIGFS